MKPSDHSIKSVRRYGGVSTDYLEIHEFLDMSKAGHPDMRHRALLHNSMGPFIAVRVFGRTITNSDGREVDVRQVCEDHLIEDMGRIPSVTQVLQTIPEEHMGFFSYRRGQVRNHD